MSEEQGMPKQLAFYKGQIETLRNYNTRVLSAILGYQNDIVKLMDYHDMITTDTSQSFDVVPHIPVIKPFASLSPEQRNSLVAFYEAFIVQAQSDLRRIRRLDITNRNILNMVNEQLEK